MLKGRTSESCADWEQVGLILHSIQTIDVYPNVRGSTNTLLAKKEEHDPLAMLSKILLGPFRTHEDDDRNNAFQSADKIPRNSVQHFPTEVLQRSYRGPRTPNVKTSHLTGETCGSQSLSQQDPLPGYTSGNLEDT